VHRSSIELIEGADDDSSFTIDAGFACAERKIQNHEHNLDTEDTFDHGALLHHYKHPLSHDIGLYSRQLPILDYREQKMLQALSLGAKSALATGDARR